MSAAGKSPSAVRRLVETARRFLERELWMADLSRMPALRAVPTRALRVLVLTIHGFVRDGCTHKAAALTYIAIFSLVPTLAFGFAVAKGFGGFEEATLDTWLESTVGPHYTVVESVTGEETRVENPLRSAAEKVREVVQDTNVNVLGVFGFVLLIYSLVKMLGAAERNLNEIWGISRHRSIPRRFTDYLAIAFVGPLFLTTGAAVGAWVRREEFVSVSLSFLAPLVSVVTPCLGMAFVLGTLPNTKVRFSSALIGGIVAGTLWLFVQGLYFTGQVSLTRYNTIYGSFAALPMFLLWVYLSWTALLAGAEAGYALVSEPGVSRSRRTGRVDQRYRERLAPRLAARAARAFLDGGGAPTAAELASELGVAPRVVSEVLEQLVLAGLLVRTTGDKEVEGYLPARDPAAITLVELLAGMRRHPESEDVPSTTPLDSDVERALGELEAALVESRANVTLARLARCAPGRLPAAEPDPEHAEEPERADVPRAAGR